MKNFFLLMLALTLISGCGNEGVIEFDDATLNSKVSSSKTLTLGFNLVFTGTYVFQGVDVDKCSPFPPMVNVVNIGEGTGTHFGHFTSHFDFCVDITDSSYPGDFEEAYFMDENGDKLFVYVEGFVLPGRVPGMPDFATSYFKDPFIITGGTGRFEGATGSGMTNDYNSANDDFSHHHWKGKITLIK